MAQNKRVFYPIEQLAVAPNGTTSFTSAHTVHGLQSVGINTRFNLEEVFELGQISLYEHYENIPDIELTAEKALDGYPLIYHLATKNATSGTLVGRSNIKSSVAMSIFPDTQDAASGTPVSQVTCSGMFISSLNYNFPTDGISTESVTLVGNNEVWTTGSFTFTGQFDNTDVPATGFISRRQHLIFGSGAGCCVLPLDVDGIDGSGHNVIDAVTGDFGAHIQSIRVSSNLGRDQMHELGRKGPYHRYVTFPVEVRCDIEVITTRGAMVGATEAGIFGGGVNLANRPIYIATQEGTKLNLGNKNKLQSTTFGGGNAGGRGGNATVTYSFSTFNDLTVVHPLDPTTALAG